MFEIVTFEKDGKQFKTVAAVVQHREDEVYLFDYLSSDRLYKIIDRKPFNRMNALEEQERLFPKNQTLPEICQFLHMATNGSTDPLPSEVEIDACIMLTMRVATWRNYNTLPEIFDEAVKNLVLATLRDVTNMDLAAHQLSLQPLYEV